MKRRNLNLYLLSQMTLFSFFLSSCEFISNLRSDKISASSSKSARRIITPEVEEPESPKPTLTPSSSVSASPAAAIILPAEPDQLAFTRAWSKLTLTWDASIDSVSGYLVVRKVDAPPSFTPVNGQAYSSGAIGSGENIIYQGPDLTFEDTSLDYAHTYHYAVYSYTADKIYSLAKTSSEKSLQWKPFATAGAAAGRTMHTGAWTGETGNPATEKRLIVWGGILTNNNADVTDGGGIYDSVTDTWSSMSNVNAPSARRWQRVNPIWTGNTGDSDTENRMIVWGGLNSGGGSLNTGAMYDPATDTWTTMNTGPAARDQHVAIWTGNTGNAATANRMIIWGSANNTPSIFNPKTNAWTNGTATGAPASKTYATAVWTGNTGDAATENRMIVWGGFSVTNAGGIYNPATDQWEMSTTTTGAPAARRWHTAVWTGTEMVVYGGYDGGGAGIANGGRYNPKTDTWTPIAQTSYGTASMFSFWTGSKVLFSLLTNDVRFYDPISNAWTIVDNVGALGKARYGTLFWTGNSLIQYSGGEPSQVINPVGSILYP